MSILVHHKTDLSYKIIISRALLRVNWVGGLFAIFWLSVIIIPIYYVIVTSFRLQREFFSGNPLAIPDNPTIGNYDLVIKNDFLTYFSNSVIVTVSSVIIVVLLSLMAAYTICRNLSPFVQRGFQIFLLGLAIPMQATIIPVYMMIIELGLYDTLWAIILPSAAFLIPITVLILVNFIRDIPQALFESMRLDGASDIKTFFSLVIPLSKPAIITVCIYDSVHIWNGFLFPLILTQSSNLRVLPLSLWSYQGEFSVNIPAVLAAVVLSAAPLLVMYLFFRRQLVGGMTAGFSR